jgi:hypothetical protein
VARDIADELAPVGLPLVRAVGVRDEEREGVRVPDVMGEPSDSARLACSWSVRQRGFAAAHSSMSRSARPA